MLLHQDKYTAWRQLPEKELPELAADIRQLIIETVAAKGGHLASNCGTVELIIALLKIFQPPEETIFFDVGHQAYTAKILTGRAGDFADTLREYGGLSGFPSPLESTADPTYAGHAGCALSAALGTAAANPEKSAKVLAVVGDGACGCGITFEALNNAAGTAGSKRLLMILNDNQMSISRNVGSLSSYLSRFIAAGGYNRFRTMVKSSVSSLPRVKKFLQHFLDVFKGAVMPPGVFFEALGFRYFGPIDGHNIPAMLEIFRKVKNLDGPLLVHVVTEKGHGCEFARKEPTRYHGISGCHPSTGEMPAGPPGFSQYFAEAVNSLAAADPRLVMVTAGMLAGTGLSKFAEKFPGRCYDVGIAEEHALTFAAGLAIGGKRPICAFYDTFLQRALDAVYHDIALPGLPVIIAADRSGAVADGPTHHGIYNLGFLTGLPHLAILTPACGEDLLPALRWALTYAGPTVIRYPKGHSTIPQLPAEWRTGEAVIRREGEENAPVFWATGLEVAAVCEAAAILQERSRLSCTVVECRFLKPFDREMARKFSGRCQITVEDHVIGGGLAGCLEQALTEIKHAPLKHFGWSSTEIIPHGGTEKLKQKFALTAADIAEKTQEFLRKQ